MPNNGNIQNDTVRDPGFEPHEDIILQSVMDRAYDNGLHFDIPFSPTIHLQSGWNIAPLRSKHSTLTQKKGNRSRP